ncbi:methionine synthase reductase-like isoform X2 [Physella acuta]|uniref:methionine synthase reductase-like isoform X2 n=1 Tax=Physella acuta TaxID=109671 RepID=UPI0027DAD035|nr:methionine synthase reductase-like isoform X2 [Physella acuta]
MLGLDKNKKSFLLVYGSETGQAKAIAEGIAEKATPFGLNANLFSLEQTGKQFNIEKEDCMVIIMSTTGDGLGDTNYSNFCRCAKDLDKRLEELGARRFYTTGFADDAVGLELVADPWLDGLYPALLKFLGVDHIKDTNITQCINKLTIEASDTVQSTQITYDDTQKFVSQSTINEDEVSNSIKTKPNRTNKEKTCIPNTLVNGSPLSSPHASLSGKDLTVPVLPPPFLEAVFSNEAVELSTLKYQNGCKMPCAASSIFHAPVITAKVLTNSKALKKTLLLQLNIKNADFSYAPGDAVSIICPNNSSEVDLLLERIGMVNHADEKLTLSVIPNTSKLRAAVPSHIHVTSTLRHIFTTCLNIREPPSKALIRTLIESTSNPIEVRRMQELCSKEGSSQYTEYVRGYQISLLDILYAFPSCYPPVERLLEHLPRLQPRPYSICSCPETSPDQLDIVFNVVEINYNVEKGHHYQRRGVCTGWLDDITSCMQFEKNAVQLIKIPIFMRTNQHFRPPEDLSKPLVMIGPGTGVAPFIGFLQQRNAKRKTVDQYGQTWLFFGCRNKSLDFIFKEELERFERDEILTKLHVSYSRDPSLPLDANSCYVQDKMRQLAPELCRLLVESNALVYVCGDAKNMAKNVNDAFEEILQKEKGMSSEDAHLFVMKKRINKTYLEDVWV